MKQYNREKCYQVAIVFTDGSREYHEASSIKILDGCLVLIDPKDVVPCEVHCFPFASIKSFIFDIDAVKGNATNLWVYGIEEDNKECPVSGKDE